MEDFFLFRENTDNIRNFQIISSESKKSVRHGLHTVKYRTPLLWANLPEKYKTATSLNSFKTEIKAWKCETCVIMPDLSLKLRIFISSICSRAF